MFFVGGRVDKIGVPQEGVDCFVFDRATGSLVGQGQTNENGVWVARSLLEATEVYAYAVVDGEQIKVFDQVVPVTEAFLTLDNIFTTNICDPVGEVGPAVLEEGGDISDHTILWEQIEGSSVTLIADDTLAPTFVNDPVGETRVFRLTIDQGEIFEQVQEYVVSGRPESTSHPRSSLVATGVLTPLSLNTSQLTRNHYIQEVQVLPKLWDEDSFNPVTGRQVSHKLPGTISWWLRWQKPAILEQNGNLFDTDGGHNFSGYEVQRWNTGTLEWDVVESIAKADETTVVTITEGFAYRVAVLWRKGELFDPLSWRAKNTNTETFIRCITGPYHAKSDPDPGQLHLQSPYAHNWNAFELISNFLVSIPTRIFKNVESVNSPRISRVYENMNTIGYSLISKGTDGLTGSVNYPRTNSGYNSDLVVVRNNGTSIGT